MKYLIPLVATLLCFAGGAPAETGPSLNEYAQTSLKDLSASVDVVSKDEDELEKIEKGYVEAYSLTSQEFFFKEPNRIRFVGKKGVLTVRRITNGDRCLFEVPLLRHKKVEDIRQRPGKGDSIADIGVITPGWLERVESRWIRSEEREGKTLQVFQYWYREDPGYRWEARIDPETRTMAEQAHLHRDPNKPGFRKRLVFTEPKQVEGIWLPTRVTLYNGEDRRAAVMRYGRIKVNTGLEDKLFEF